MPGGFFFLFPMFAKHVITILKKMEFGGKVET